MNLKKGFFTLQRWMQTWLLWKMGHFAAKLDFSSFSYRGQFLMVEVDEKDDQKKE